MVSLKQNQKCLIIAEVAQAHDGSLGMAHAYVDAIAKTGADAVKFQTHIASAESTAAEPWRVKFSTQDSSRYDYWKRMEFSEEQWKGLKEHAEACGLIFLSSPFSFAAVDLLERIGIKAWKVASGEVSNTPMLDRIIASGLPIMLSSGMSSFAELDGIVKLIRDAQVDITLFHCSSIYPTPPDKLGLNVLPVFKKRYDCKVGLSDHSGTIYAGLAACAHGLDALEVHVAFSREVFGPDVCASVTTAELHQMVQGIRFIEKAMLHPIDKDEMAGELSGLKTMFSKSVVAALDLPAGTVLTREHLDLRKPGTGIPPHRLSAILGTKLQRTVLSGQILNENDFKSKK